MKREDLARFLRDFDMPIPSALAPEKPRVLVVDDDQSVRESVKAALQASAKYEVESCAGGFECGQRVIEWKPDVILLDFVMPDLDGFEVCRLLKANDATRDISIVAMTVITDEEKVRQMRRMGVYAHIAKPFDMAALLATIEGVISGAKRQKSPRPGRPRGRA